MDPEETLNLLEEALKTPNPVFYRAVEIVYNACQDYETWRRRGGYASTKDQTNLDFRYHTLRVTMVRKFQDVRDYYEAAVRSPGRFESESPWTPYLWDVTMLDGSVTTDDGEFPVVLKSCDVLLWPQLIKGAAYWLYQNEQGFVTERHQFFP